MGSTKSAHDFERHVAALFRLLGAEVKHDVALAGNQVDIVIEERTPSGSSITSAVECQAYSRPVGVQAVVAFASLTTLLRQRNLINRAILVGQSGFTRHAREAAEAHGVELLDVADLEARLGGEKSQLHTVTADFTILWESEATSPNRPRKIFVVMPFGPEFNDVYILGIRDVTEKLGLVAERADDIEHNENIIDVIYAKIRASDAIVADTTTKNPHCFYEIGYAHALDKPTILISREGEAIPFDLQAKNHIFYSSIVELRESLARRLKAALKLSE